MIHLTNNDVRSLNLSCQPIGVKTCATTDCSACNVAAVCSALSWVILAYKDETKHSEIEGTLHSACVSFRDYTDKVCDTYFCPNCSYYSWCTILRGIAIEGVKLDN